MRPSVFLSRQAVLTENQARVFGVWSSYLQDLGFQVERLQRYHYSSNPWGQLRKIFARTEGMVAFGCSQVSSEARERENKRSKCVRISPWIHIEAAMAI